MVGLAGEGNPGQSRLYVYLLGLMQHLTHGWALKELLAEQVNSFSGL